MALLLVLVAAVEFGVPDASSLSLPAANSGPGFAALDKVEDRLNKFQGELKAMGIQVEKPTSVLETGKGSKQQQLSKQDDAASPSLLETGALPLNRLLAAHSRKRPDDPYKEDREEQKKRTDKLRTDIDADWDAYDRAQRLPESAHKNSFKGFGKDSLLETREPEGEKLTKKWAKVHAEKEANVKAMAQLKKAEATFETQFAQPSSLLETETGAEEATETRAEEALEASVAVGGGMFDANLKKHEDFKARTMVDVQARLGEMRALVNKRMDNMVANAKQMPSKHEADLFAKALGVVDPADLARDAQRLGSPTSFLETDADVDDAGARGVHARLKQSSEKMAADIAQLQQLSRTQDADEGFGVGSLLETREVELLPLTPEVDKLAKKWAKASPSFAQELKASSLLQSRFGEVVPPGMEAADKKINAAEEQLRRMDQEFKQPAKLPELPELPQRATSFAQETAVEPEVAADAEDSEPDALADMERETAALSKVNLVQDADNLQRGVSEAATVSAPQSLLQTKRKSGDDPSLAAELVDDTVDDSDMVDRAYALDAPAAQARSPLEEAQVGGAQLARDLLAFRDQPAKDAQAPGAALKAAFELPNGETRPLRDW